MDLADYNMDHELRDSKLIEPEYVAKYGDGWKYFGGTKGFANMDYTTLQWMVDNKFADLEERQNDAPAIGKFLTFLDINRAFRATGYVVSHQRDDYRLSVEGITGNDLSATDLLVFTDFAHEADEFDMSEAQRTARAWWD